MSLSLCVTSETHSDLASTVFVYVNPADFAELCRLSGQRSDAAAVTSHGVYVQIKGSAFSVMPSDDLPLHHIYFNMGSRQTVAAPHNVNVVVSPLTPAEDFVDLRTLTVEIGYFRTDDKTKRTLDCSIACDALHRDYNRHFFNRGQFLYMRLAFPEEVVMRLTVREVEGVHVGGGGGGADLTRGILQPETEIKFLKAPKHPLTLENTNQARATDMFATQELSFSSMGVGGLDGQFAEIFRRAFASRLFPPEYVRKLGLTHVKGILMHGPPGCGKTLVARQISKALKARKPKIVNGPEVFSRYVGASEEKIRELFADAEKECVAQRPAQSGFCDAEAARYEEAGDASQLHVIIFDEIDAICKKRGTVGDTTGVNDSVVNQLLSKLDGVDALNNILVIGMTNRPDMIDAAVTRPGRLEVKIEIGLPDEQGRVQILNIHTSKFVEHGVMGEGISISDLARRTKNFTGAEIEGLCRSSASFALNRQVDPLNPSKRPDVKAVKIVPGDFEAAFKEVKPAFGTEEEDLRRLYDLGIIPFSDDFTDARSRLLTFARQVSQSDADGVLVSVLVEGRACSGKTALMASLALEAGFPYVKLVTADQLIRQREGGKVACLHDAFEHAYMTPLAMILIDDVERLLEYANVCNSVKFSNMVLQALLVLLKRRPPSRCRLMVVVTTSVLRHLQLLHLDAAFYSVVHVPELAEPDEFKAVLNYSASGINAAVVDEVARSIKHPMGVKKLLNALETARQECGKDDGAITVQALESALALAPVDNLEYDSLYHVGGSDGCGN